MAEVGRPVVAGAVLGLSTNLACRVRLDSGEQVSARIPRRTARLMFRIVPGHRVRVQPDGRGGFVVLGHE